MDVGSGGGTPGIPLAASLPEREVTLLEAERRKAEFLEQWTDELPNLRVIWGRAESQGTDCYKVAVAKALARPPVAAEWCLPLVAEGGVVILWVGPSVDEDAVCRVAARSRASPSSRRAAFSSCGRPARHRRAFPVGRASPRSARSPDYGAGSALRSRMPLNSSVEATTGFQSGHRFGRTRSSISAVSCKATRSPSGLISRGSTVSRLSQ